MALLSTTCAVIGGVVCSGAWTISVLIVRCLDGWQSRVRFVEFFLSAATPCESGNKAAMSFILEDKSFGVFPLSLPFIDLWNLRPSEYPE